jgi:hypothetical protein
VSPHAGSINVIASQRVGAKRRPMTGSAKQSSFLRTAAKKSWIASSQALLAMTWQEQRINFQSFRRIG